jgi:nucleotide-binding universal stress UspA family protein
MACFPLEDYMSTTANYANEEIVARESRAEFAGKCQTNVETAIAAGLHYLVAVDGSDAADMALHQCFALRRKQDFVTVFHAYRDSTPEATKHEFRADALRARYEKELAQHVTKGLYRLAWEPRGAHKSVAETVQDYLLELRKNSDNSGGWRSPNFLVMGSRGRKAVQGTTYAPLSSNADWFLRSLGTPCVITKRGRGSSRTTPKHWMMAVDGTVYTNRALDMLFTLIKPKDSLEVFYVRPGKETLKDTQYIEYMREYYERELAEQGPAISSFKLIKKQEGEALADTVVRYVNEQDPHYLAMGPRATAYQHLSPLMVQVVNNVNCNLMIGMN